MPNPVSLRWLHEVLDNSVAIATFEGPTSELRFDSTVALEHVETALPDYPLEEYAKTYPFRYSDDELPNLGRNLVHHYPSDEVRRWVKQFLDPSGTTGTVSLLRSITVGIKKDLLYACRSEKGVQRPSETLENRRGSCRDFAVLMMEAARSLGLAARFASGYIGWRRRDGCVDAGLPAGYRLDRLRSNQQYRWQSQSYSCCRRVGSQAGSAAVGHI